MELSDCEGGLIWKDVVEADKAAAVKMVLDLSAAARKSGDGYLIICTKLFDFLGDQMLGAESA